MTTKTTQKSFFVLLLVITIVLVSGCTSSSATGDSSKTQATPTATAVPSPTSSAGSNSTGTPGSNGAPGATNGTQTPTQVPQVTATPSPAPTSTPTVTPTSNPYSNPGWPNYGVYYYLNMNQPVTTPTGKIHGHVYEYIPSASPMPMGTSYGAFATTDPGNMSAYRYDFVDSDGYYEITGLSYGTYEVGWFHSSLEWYEYDSTVTLDTSEVLVDILVYPV